MKMNNSHLKKVQMLANVDQWNERKALEKCIENHDCDRGRGENENLYLPRANSNIQLCGNVEIATTVYAP